MSTPTPIVRTSGASNAGTVAASDPGEAQHGKGPEKLTIQSYSKAAQWFVQLATGAGANHGTLAAILQPFCHDRPYNPSKVAERCLTYCGFARKSEKQWQSSESATSSSANTTKAEPEYDMGKSQSFDSCKSFHEFDTLPRTESPGHLLFIRGHLSAEWIGLIGSKHKVDPEYLAQVFDFRSPDDRNNCFSSPGLPAASWNTIRLPLMTIGFRDGSEVDKKQFHTARALSAKYMKKHHDILETPYMSDYQKIPVGGSYVRDYHIFDGKYVAVEQAVTICLQPAEEAVGWTGTRTSPVGVPLNQRRNLGSKRKELLSGP